MDHGTRRAGVGYAGSGVWFREGDERNKHSPVPITERPSITRAELTTALRALSKKCPGKPLHLITDSELVYVRLKGKYDKWCRHKWVGSWSPLARADLWSDMWSQWVVLGDSISIQSVPSHVGVDGNERADQ